MGKKQGCSCAGHWRHKLEHFVVTRRNEMTTITGQTSRSDYSEVKCLQCKRKWRSKAGYVAQLRDYQERKYKRMTYRRILSLIRAGRIQVDFGTGEVWKERKRGKGGWSGEMTKLSARPNRDAEGRCDSTRDRGLPYYFVVICDCHYRREVTVSRVVWMAYHDRIVPKGYDIDHRDGDKTNNAISNLKLEKERVNRGVHAKTKMSDEIPF